MSSVFDNTSKVPAVQQFFEQFAIDLNATTGLNISIYGGNCIIASVLTVLPETALVLTDNATQYIVINPVTGALLVVTSVVSPKVPLYALTTANGQITGCQDLRLYFFPAAAIAGATTVALATATGVVNVGAAPAPTAGQVLTATDGTDATWQTMDTAAMALHTNGVGVVAVNAATPPSAGQVLMATSPTNAAWSSPVSNNSGAFFRNQFFPTF